MGLHIFYVETYVKTLVDRQLKAHITSTRKRDTFVFLKRKNKQQTNEKNILPRNSFHYALLGRANAKSKKKRY